MEFHRILVCPSLPRSPKNQEKPMVFISFSMFSWNQLFGSRWRSWAAPSAFVGGFWALLGRSWAALGRSEAALGRSWGALGRVLGALGRVLGPLGSLLCALGSILAALDHLRDALGRGLGLSWTVSEPLLGHLNCTKPALCPCALVYPPAAQRYVRSIWNMLGVP